MNATETIAPQASASAQHLVDQIAEEFVARLRRGERPPISEYESRYPEQAAAIRELFPTLVMMEQLKPVSVPVRPASQSECASEVASLGKLGDYRIVREVGRGGMGIVYEAVQESLGRQVALKVLPKQRGGDDSRQARFEREARAAARLHHTNIVPVFGVGAENGLHYYAMQYIHGLGLDEVLRELKRLKSTSHTPATLPDTSPPAEAPRHAVTVTVTQALFTGDFEAGGVPAAEKSAEPAPAQIQPSAGPSLSDTAKARLSDTVRVPESLPLPGGSAATAGNSRQTFWQSVARIGVQVGEALHYAHEQGVLHRDIKPSNLLLDTRGTVWVTDFGLAKANDQRDLTETGDVLGTLRYMAPEMFSGQADRRSDVYSLGLSLYELLALRPAFDEADRGRLIRLVLHESPPRLRTLDPAIPRDLETIVHKAIDREPSHRYASAQEVADDLTRFLNDEPIHARRVSLAARFTRWCKRNPAVAGLTSTIALLLLVATGVSFAAALSFQRMARDNSQLAGNLKSALADAQKHLREVKKQEQLARTNLDLATAEQQRAEGNLDLALTALDAVYLDAIGTEKLLGNQRTRPQPGAAAFSPAASAPLTDLEKELLKRGLSFYDQFAQQNAATPRAAVHTAQAHFRVALLQGALGDNAAAESAYRAAIERFEALAKDEPNNVEYHRRLGESYSGLSRTISDWHTAKPYVERSFEAFTRAISLSANDATLYAARAQARVSAPTKRDDLVKAAELAPNNLTYQLHAAQELYYHGGGPEKARPFAERAFQLAPDSPLTAVVMAYAAPNEPERVKYLTLAIERDPQFVSALHMRGGEYIRRGDFARALADGQKAVALDPENSRALCELGQALVGLKRYDEAEQALERAFRSDPHYWVTSSALGKLRFGQKQFDKAVEAWSRAIEMNPRADQLAKLYKRRAVAHYHRGRFAEALADLTSALTKNPTDPSALTWIPPAAAAACPDQPFKDGLLRLANDTVATNPAARSYRAVLALHLGQRDLAREDLAELIKATREQATPYDLYEVALLHLADNRNIEGYRATCREMLTRFADSPKADALAYLGWTCALVPGALTDYRPAIAALQRGLASHPNDPELRRSLGALQYRAGQYETARQTLEPLRGLEQTPVWARMSAAADPYFFLAMTHHALGDAKQARAVLAKADAWTDTALAFSTNQVVWYRRLTLELLQKEAEELLGPAAPAPDAPPAEKQPPSP